MILEADCIDAMRDMDEASVDAIVTDPPYGLEFMGKEWDRLGRNSPPSFQHSMQDNFKGFKPLPRPGGLTIEGMHAAQQWHQAWATEALRVLKPGGHLLAFGGTRTYHRLACAIEDAGFEIRDSVIWLYGSGFPKSLDVSKAIDKAAGAEREVVGEYEVTRDLARNGRTGDEAISPVPVEGTTVSVTAPATPEAQQWQGWGTALKPAHEPIVVARKPLIGTVAQNVQRFGTGAIAIDACRVGENGNGRWPSNCALSHLPECERVGTRRVESNAPATWQSGGIGGYHGVGEHRPGDTRSAYADPDGTEQVEAWRCAEGCPVAELDRQSGDVKGAVSNGKVAGTGYHENFGTQEQVLAYGDSGGAARFFYTAKASRSERSAGLDGSADGNGKTCVCRDAKRQADTQPLRATDADTEAGDNGSSTTGSGSSTTGRSPKASKSTTETATARTTASKTSPSSRPPSTSASTRPTSDAATDGNAAARSAASGSPPTPNTSTSTSRAGSSTDDADPAISRESLPTSSGASNVCPDCGGVISGALRNSHPTLGPSSPSTSCAGWSDSLPHRAEPS